jgi:hypothetical protein
VSISDVHPTGRGTWCAAAAGAVAIASALISPVRAAIGPAPVLRYEPGSTTRIEQLIGDVDRQTHRPTLSLTETRFGVEGTDLGSSFEHDGRVYFLFGDTLGSAGRALDSIGVTDARDPEAGARVDFLTAPSARPRRAGRAGRRGRAAVVPPGEQTYLTVQPPGISMGAFEVPVAGLDLDGRTYVVVSTNHTEDRMSERSVLTRFTMPDGFQALRTISQLPQGHFVKMSLHAGAGDTGALSHDGPFVFMWGTGRYRQSDAYFAAVPASHFEDGDGTRYFAGTDATGTPVWSTHESDAQPVVRNGTMGDVSVTWCGALGLWLMTYDSRPPAPQGIELTFAPAPWGPWSAPQVIFNAARDGAYGTFIHDPRRQPSDGLGGPVIGQGRGNPEGVRGGAYAPYVIERWTRVANGELTLYYTLSTWNPYVVVLMRSRLRVG